MLSSNLKPFLLSNGVKKMGGVGECVSGLAIRCGECTECLFLARLKATLSWFGGDLGLQRAALARVVAACPLCVVGFQLNF